MGRQPARRGSGQYEPDQARPPGTRSTYRGSTGFGRQPALSDPPHVVLDRKLAELRDEVWGLRREVRRALRAVGLERRDVHP